jgi:hypothetical protein
MRKLMGETPRAFKIHQQDMEAESMPANRKRVSREQIARRAEPLLSLVAAGDIPVDQNIAQLIKTYTEHTRGQIQH